MRTRLDGNSSPYWSVRVQKYGLEPITSVYVHIYGVCGLVIDRLGFGLWIWWG